jgi:hypothetical protein
MLRLVAVFGLSTAVAGAAVPLTLNPRAGQQPSPAEFQVSLSSGYEIDNCLNQDGGCRTIVAQAWCEAQGFSRAIAMRPNPLRQDFSVSCTHSRD